MVRGIIQQEELTILSIYAPNPGALRFTKQVLRDKHRDLGSHIVTLGDLTPTTVRVRQINETEN